jgi:hypothetical protein
VWIAVGLVGLAARAQSTGEEKPVGFPAGPFVIGPSFTAGYSYDSNVFLLSDSASPPPSADQVLTLEPALQLTLPFSNSMFKLGDTLKYVDYQHTAQTAGKTSNDAAADLVLNFGSLDTIELSAHHIAGVADTLAFDPGGEVKFQGNAFRFHTEGVSVSRAIVGVRGYRFSVQRNVLRFDPSTNVQFFDYSGFDGEGAYLQPLSSNTRLAFGYLGARYDHFDASPSSDPSAVFRTERGDAVYAEIEGQLGPKQPYSVRVGWEELDFTGNSAKDFSGLIGQVKLSAIVGGGTTITFSTERRPYRSFFQENNYYVFEQVGGSVLRSFPRGSNVGGDVSFSRNTYNEPAAGILRRDQTVFLEAYANLTIRDHVVFRLSATKNRKYSNYPGADFNATVVFGGFVLGWI